MEDELVNGYEEEPEVEEPEIEEPEQEEEEEDNDLTFFGLNFGTQIEEPNVPAPSANTNTSAQLDAIVAAYAGSKVMQDIVHYRAEGYDDKTILEALYKINLEQGGQSAQDDDDEPLSPKVQI